MSLVTEKRAGILRRDVTTPQLNSQLSTLLNFTQHHLPLLQHDSIESLQSLLRPFGFDIPSSYTPYRPPAAHLTHLATVELVESGCLLIRPRHIN